MSVSPRTAPVLIIGCGIGGLALANVLQGNGVPFLIFERDPQLNGRHQGYRFRLLQHGLEALKGVCDAVHGVDLWDKVQASFSMNIPPRVNINAVTGKIEVPQAFGGTQGDNAMNPAALERLESINKLNASKKNRRHTDRATLRRVLMEPVVGNVRFDRKFLFYEVDANGVTAYFDDGSAFKGSLLVGADGVRSKVAKQLLGDASNLHDYGLMIIFGRTPLRRSLAESLPEELRDSMGYCRVKRERGMLTFFTEPLRFDPEYKARFPRLKVPDDYIFFGLVGQKILYRPDLWFPDSELKGADSEDIDMVVAGQRIVSAVNALTPPQRAELVCLITKDFHPHIHAILEQQDENEPTVGSFLTADPYNLHIWDTNPWVTVIGDAFHATGPTASNGANLALMSGFSLGTILSREWPEARERSGWSKKALREFEDSMREVAQPIVQEVYENAVLEFGACVHPKYSKNV